MLPSVGCRVFRLRVSNHTSLRASYATHQQKSGENILEFAGYLYLDQLRGCRDSQAANLTRSIQCLIINSINRLDNSYTKSVFRHKLTSPRMSLINRIQSHEKVVEYLGSWPSFHDFEVASMFLDRGEVINGDAPFLEIEFFGFRGDVAPDEPDRKSCNLKIRFEDIEDISLTGFNHQNAILGMQVSSRSSDRHGFSVTIRQVFGVGCEFECERIKVISIVPWNPSKPKHI